MIRLRPRHRGRSLADVAAARGVCDRRVLDAMRVVDRVRFVPPREVRLAEHDGAVDIGHGQTTSQPSLIAMMLEALQLRGGETVLEIGSGLGYQTAVLAGLAGRVWGIEWWPDLAAAARRNLAGAGVGNAQVVVGDGGLGLPDRAPFDAIVVSAAFPTVPPPLVEQLREGGRLVQPIGPSGDEEVTLFTKRRGELVPVRVVALALFVPLLGAHGAPGRHRDG